MLTNLPKDILMIIAIDYDVSTLFNLCRASKKLNEALCDNDIFWMKKLEKDYGKYLGLNSSIINLEYNIICSTKNK